MTPEEKFAGIDLKKIEAHELQSVEDCAYAMIELDRIIADIDSQLREARVRVITDGEYSDAQWFSATQYALKSAKRARSLAQERRGAISRRSKAEALHEESQRSERRFVEAAKLILDKETYLRIWAFAHGNGKDAA